MQAVPEQSSTPETAETPHQALSAEAIQVLHKVVEELPDACERLRYVQSMTEQAANKVLGLVDGALEDAEQVRSKGMDLASALGRLAQSEDLSIVRARAMMKLCADYAASAAAFAGRERSLHTELMMSQDFQDLSGQVINKVIAMLEKAEKPLEHLLADSEPPREEQPLEHDGSVQALEGVQTPDKALKQDDVDDLLASLGF
ncbi:protein phosphatase CheZ [Paucibacter sp. APW11]|uniref:Protein phosphatase CheZ n=1 Tax=Roseateles aquae TaxID=3077235 RepID=A0ABU3PI65_9BURK|nr:protein phosphatase CheZ [Paucibacter sp. APW11]MDT9002223.1 protein phosphatase CheZ [Paucibacter sp. APW11]